MSQLCSLQPYRPLLLACETIGWLHMIEKASIDFLRRQGGQNSGESAAKWFEELKFALEILNAIKKLYQKDSKKNPDEKLDASIWPENPEDFFTQYSERNGTGLLGLLQAAHAMASGIEKQSYKDDTIKYLKQDTTHLWSSTAFGHPLRNLVVDPPELLGDEGRKGLLDAVRQLLEGLLNLSSSSSNENDSWGKWRQEAVGIKPPGWLRKAFSATVAETRLPNNDVTLFDQSYVAAALFKSAVAGALLEGDAFPWSNSDHKNMTRWRLLTVAVGIDHFEARSVRIGDWTGTRLALDAFFEKVRSWVEVELAVGSLLYADGGIWVFSFPGERFGKNESSGGKEDDQLRSWKDELLKTIDQFASEAGLELPPYCRLGESSRSLVGMAAEIRKAREAVATPLHRDWSPHRDSRSASNKGHICPVCLVREGEGLDKQSPCAPCRNRRTRRLEKWLSGDLERDSIWFGEVADANDRLALLTMSLDIEPWLDGSRVDALRAQAIPQWAENNPQLKGPSNQTGDIPSDFPGLVARIKERLLSPTEKNSKLPKDLVLESLQSGYKHEAGWESFFAKIVEDRTESVRWDDLDTQGRAEWLAHQLLRKLPSPGRIYRFQRQVEEFFQALLGEFRAIAASHANRWRVRRLWVEPMDSAYFQGKDNQTYHGRYREAPLGLLFREDAGKFLTISNLARVFKPEEEPRLPTEPLFLKSDDGENIWLSVKSVHEVKDDLANLAIYHPLIPLDLSPVRFRVLLPLEALSACVDLAIERWKEQFARVWDRLPLRVGVVAFPRMTPFQAAIEAARNLESGLETAQGQETETWRLTNCETREGIVSLVFQPADRTRQILQTVPIRLPGERKDLFYPYFVVEDGNTRFPRDFRHPDGRVFRHAEDLRSGDGVRLYPSLVSTLFLEGTAQRFDPPAPRPLSDWPRMRELFRMLDRSAPSPTALRGAWSELIERRQLWQSPEGGWALGKGDEKAWLEYSRAVLSDRLGIRGALLDELVEAAQDDLLDWSLEWHLRVLKHQISGKK